MNTLFINHGKSQCGVYNYGTRLYDIWKKSLKLKFNYVEVNSLDEYNRINFDNYHIIFYNFHGGTLPWLNKSNITTKCINIGILHESYADMFNYCIDTAGDIPRPIFDNIPTEIVSTNKDDIEFLNYGLDLDIPIIGSFGFGFKNKGFDRIVQYVNQQFDKAIIKIIMTFPDFGDKTGEQSKYIAHLCHSINKNDNIKILITHNYFDNNDILYFLSKNTVNSFLYDRLDGRGLSSTIDFAMSVHTPLCISDSYMFRHIYNDNISLYKNSFKDCMINSVEHSKYFKQKNSHNKLINFIENYTHTILPSA